MTERSHFPQCVITGCLLVCPNEDKCAYGDLHKVGGTYVLNAVPEYRGENLLALRKLVVGKRPEGVSVNNVLADGWVHGIDWKAHFDSDMRVVAVASDFIYDKRAVMVFPAGQATLNKPALERITPKGGRK